MRSIFYISILISCLCVGCSSLGTFNPATGRNELILVSTSQEVAMGLALHEDILKEYTLSDDRDMNARLKLIGEKIASVSDRMDYEHQFFVVAQDDLNAFTIPGGRIYVNTGLMKRVKSNDQLAAVIAHEIAHGSARHTVKKFQAGLGYSLISDIVFGQMDDASTFKRIASIGTNTAMSLIFSSYSRQDEFEADRLGVKYMKLAGYDPQAAIEVFVILAGNTQDSATPLFLRSHPYLKDRISAIQQLIKEKH